LETTSNEVGKTIDNKSIQNVPSPGRETLNFALLMPGVGNTQGNDRYSTYNGLPNASLDLTVDGMNDNSQRWKSGGTSFYEFGPSRVDAMEQVTVSTTGLGAEAGGQGAMQIRMTTKRGTDQYHFKVLEQLANEDFNANSYFTPFSRFPARVAARTTKSAYSAALCSPSSRRSSIASSSSLTSKPSRSPAAPPSPATS
jgi:hypothetical protein